MTQPERATPKYSQSQMEELLRDQQDSGLTLPSYCKLHDLPYERLVYCRRKLQGPTRPRRRQAPQPSAFVPVAIRDSGSNASSRGEMPPGAQPKATMDVLLRGGHTVRVNADFDAPALRRLIDVMEAIAC